jgi:TldD protein
MTVNTSSRRSSSMALPVACNRRQFLSTLSVAAGGVVLGSRQLSAAEMRGTTPHYWLEAGLAPEQLRALAKAALDAATASGATYADVRVAYRQQYRVGTGNPFHSDTPRSPRLEAFFEGGVRALAGGAFGFHFANIPTVDALQTAGRAATSLSTGFAAMQRGPVEFAQAPAAQGSWVSPYTIDPFTVPLDEQADLVVALERAVRARLPKARGSASMGWERETRVCMSTTGMLTTQIFMRMIKDMGHSGATANLSRGLTEIWSPYLHGEIGRHAGYEAMTGAALQDRLKALAEATAPKTMYPTRTLDVGRYPVVFDGSATASLLTQLVGPAFQLDRVLGLEANASGTSFLSPLERLFETQLVPPQLTLAAGRPTEFTTGTKWDDEGVAPQAVTLLEQGRVVNYLSDRQTAPAMRDAYTKRGYCSSATADRPPTVGAAHFTLAPNTASTSQDDLMREITHGVLLLGPMSILGDQQLASGLMRGRMAEIRNGKMVNYLDGTMGMQFRTVQLLKSLKALGDTGTVGEAFDGAPKGEPSQMVWNSATAPAMLCSAGDFVSTKGGH